MKSDLSTDTIIKQNSASMLQQIQSHAQKMCHKIKKNDSKQISRQELYQIKTQLNELKKNISLAGISIREAREEGRRY